MSLPDHRSTAHGHEEQMPPRVVVRRSARRRKSVLARREGDAIVVVVPAAMSAAEEQRWVDKLVRRVLAKERRRPGSDDELMRRALELSRTHLEPVVGHPVRPASVRWVTNQNRRWGSCTPSEATIRLSSRMQSFPAWVVDHVLLHELVHLVEPNHTPRFHALVALNPTAQKAEGFLEGYAVGAGSQVQAGEPSDTGSLASDSP